MKMRLFMPALFLSGLLFAQQSKDLTVHVENDSVKVMYRLDEVVIYGRKQARSSMVTELSPVEIRQRQGQSVADVLRVETGLSITTGPKAETETRIRGFMARDVLVLVDGRPINPGYYGKADLNMLPKDNIAKIKVVKGPASVAYGANSMGGVINIVTHNGFGKPSTSLDVEAGEDATRKISLNHTGRRGRFFYWLSGYEQHSDGFRLSDDFVPTSLEDGGLRENSSYHKAGMNAKIGFAPSPNTTYSLSAGYHWAEKSVPSTTTLLADMARYRFWPRWERYGVSLSGHWTRSPLLEIKAVTFVDAYNDRFQEFSDAAMDADRLNFDSLLENWTVGGSTELFYTPAESHRLRSGLHFRRDLMNKKPDSDEGWFSHHHVTASVFAEDEYRLRAGTVITAGVSGHYFSSESDGGIEHLSPMLGVVQSLPAGLTLRASWANAMRFPTMHQLYSSSSGNEGLHPEEADKAEIGLERSWTLLPQKGWRLYAETAYFRNRLDNLIYRSTRNNRYGNIAEAVLDGVESKVALRLPPWFNLTLQYTWVDAGRSTRELMDEMPEHQWGINLRGQLPFSIDYHYDFNYFHERSSVISSTRAVMLNAYNVHHAGLSRPVGHGVTLRIEGRNLLDENYQEELGYPAPGRQWLAGLSWKR